MTSLKPLQKEAVSRKLGQLVERTEEELRPVLEAVWARSGTFHCGSLRRALNSMDTYIFYTVYIWGLLLLNFTTLI